MKIALLAKNKLGFVDDTCSKDSLPEEMGYQWERCNAIVLSWILNTVSKELLAGIVFTSSAAAVWNNLCEQQNVEHSLQQRLFQFLMGLNGTYNAVRSHIFLLNPLPSVSHAYSMLVQEDSQRQHSSSDVGADPISFHSVHMVQKKRFNGTCDHCKIKGHKRENCYRLISYPADFKFTKKKANTSSGSIVNNASAIDSASGNELSSNISSCP
ncbi:uncharacterized protein LOC108478034 [Gossypium arboreum]|uniref:Retrotransposon Copia-like N-terminal domain-containing protein n=1 Tax=Gossypium arboreum TaxID=29729 RepID=A0ABR0P313_GOSAR|nr:uncharacterized protein LOC108478034 [Gossypium arboreum]KAK5812097.1 hypothetical protein PVK06_027502 [Gossypium arboreum]